MLALLNCQHCSDDRLLITIALLTTMNLLPWYASAAALTGAIAPGAGTDHVLKTSASAHGSPTSSMPASPSHDQPCPRQAKQQVLRELHPVQRLITLLSARLKGLEQHNAYLGLGLGLGFRAGEGAVVGASQPQSALKEPERSYQGRRRMMHTMPGQAGFGDAALMMPISPRALEALEMDARSSLGFLSAAVRNALKES